MGSLDDRVYSTPAPPFSMAVSASALPQGASQPEEGSLVFYPPLYSQRAELVHRTLQRFGCRRVVDAGCSNGDLLQYVMRACSLCASQLTHVLAIDMDRTALDEASRQLPQSWSPGLMYTEDAVVHLLQGDLTSTASLPRSWAVDTAAETSWVPSVDAVISVEVVEHIPPHLVAAYTYTVFVELGAARGATTVLMTTPNRDENYRCLRRDAADGVGHRGSNNCNSVYCPWASAPWRRHPDHRFELTRRQWMRYVRYVEACYGAYWVAEAPPVLLGNAFSQGTIFVARPEWRARAGGKAEAGERLPHPPQYGTDAFGGFSFQGRHYADAATLAEQGCAVRRGHAETASVLPPPLSSSGSSSAAPPFVCPSWNRAAALAEFPFEEIFGMSWDEYTLHFFPSPLPAPITSRDDEGAVATASPCGYLMTEVAENLQNDKGSKSCDDKAREYVLFESRVITGVPLWQRFCDAVRRGHEAHMKCGPTHALQLPAGRPTRPTAMRLPRSPQPFAHFVTDYLVPPLYPLLERCALPFLLDSCLAGQLALWRDSVTHDWAEWTRFVRKQRRRWALLRISGFVPEDALLQYGRPASAGGPSLASVSSSVFCLPLVHPDSVAYHTLKKLSSPMSGFAGASPDLSEACFQGEQLLARAAVNAAGFLLCTWVCAQVRRSSALDVVGAAPHSSSPLTMRHLSSSTLQALFFLVSVDVLPAAWDALQQASGGRVMALLRRDAEVAHHELFGEFGGRATLCRGCASERRRFHTSPSALTNQGHLPRPCRLQQRDTLPATGLIRAPSMGSEKLEILCPTWLQLLLRFAP